MSEYSTHEAPFAPMDPQIVRVASFWFGLDQLEEVELPMPRGLLVGEQPRPGGNPKLPLWPYPDNCAGARLFQMSEMKLITYFIRLARVNVARRPVANWNPRGARRRALEMLETLPDGARVVACGARARDALGIGTWFTRQQAYLDEDRVQMVAIPHPSGRTREYNDPEVKLEAGRWIRWAAGLED